MNDVGTAGADFHGGTWTFQLGAISKKASEHLCQTALQGGQATTAAKPQSVAP